jgi:type IV secretion system protein VirD4
MTAFNEEFRFGSARWAEESELRRAGLFVPKGPQIGFWQQKPIFSDSDAPILTVAGSGAGKTTTILSYVHCNAAGQRMVTNDPRGELAAISMAAHAAHGEHVYCLNPFGFAGLPQHRINPLAGLARDTPTLQADVALLCENLIAPSPTGDSRYFGQRAQQWLASVILWRVETCGGTSLPDVWRVIGLIETDAETWNLCLDSMLVSRFESVRRNAGELRQKQAEVPKEFGAILGELYSHLAFLDVDQVREALEESDIPTGALVDPARVCKLFLNIPPAYMKICAPLLKVVITSLMLLKERHPQAPRILFVIDEAAQLGAFPMLLQAVTYLRGAGIRTWTVWQDLAAIDRHHGRGAMQTVIGSSETRMFFGVRDLQTATLISEMLGTESLRFDQALDQSEARKRKQEAFRNALRGGDPFALGHETAHQERAAHHRAMQGRPLLTPSEILTLPHDRQILMISNLPPVLAHRYPYFTRREMAGRYLPNPYHPPADRVRIKTSFGTKWAEVVTEETPEFFRSFPQYTGGNPFQYVKGHRPKSESRGTGNERE